MLQASSSRTRLGASGILRSPVVRPPFLRHYHWILVGFYGDHLATGSTCTKTWQQQDVPSGRNGHPSHAREWKNWKPSHNSQNLSNFILNSFIRRHFSLLRGSRATGCRNVSAVAIQDEPLVQARMWMVTWESYRQLSWEVFESWKGIFRSSRKVLDGCKTRKPLLFRC